MLVLEPSDGVKMVLPVSQILMAYKILLSLFGTDRSEKIHFPLAVNIC